MKHILSAVFAVCLAVGMFSHASALSYKIAEPGDPDYGTATSVEPVITADGGAMENKDLSKNAAIIPPGFGTVSMDTRNTGSYLTPNLAPDSAPAVGAVVNGSGVGISVPENPFLTGQNSGSGASTVTTSTGYTKVTSDLYYSGGYLGTLKIPSIDLSVKVYQGTDSSTLMTGAGHFPDTSIWDGNCCIAGHNRGVRDDFGDLHTLDPGDTITWTTKLGTRTYEVVSVEKVLETDTSGTAATTDNRLTLFTCVRDQRAYRWQVQAVEV